MHKVRAILSHIAGALSRRGTPAAPSQPQAASHLVEPGRRAVEVPVAGVIYHESGAPALGLRLRETVRLRREPDNPHDPNAVAVESGRGRPFGYIPRHLAAQVSRALESGAVRAQAVVTRLVSDPASRTVGVGIALSVHSDLDLLAPSRFEFSCEAGSEGAVYVLLNCDSALLNEVQDGLARRGLGCERTGQTFRPAADGNVYDWYVRMADEVGQEDVAAYFAEEHGLGLWRPAETETLEMYAQAFDGELDAKEQEISQLRAALESAREETRRAKKGQQVASASALKALVDGMLPKVVLLRDSWDVVSLEIPKPEDVLRHLHEICCSPAEIRAKAVRGAQGWRELHFSTGQRDIGRLYFRQAGQAWEALVSLKSSQEKDIAYLRKL